MLVLSVFSASTQSNVCVCLLPFWIHHFVWRDCRFVGPFELLPYWQVCPLLIANSSSIVNSDFSPLNLNGQHRRRVNEQLSILISLSTIIDNYMTMFNSWRSILAIRGAFSLLIGVNSAHWPYPMCTYKTEGTNHKFGKTELTMRLSSIYGMIHSFIIL